VNPRVQFQPARTAAVEATLLKRYSDDGLAAPNLDALPWGALLEPEYGRSFEYGMKTDLFGEKVMINLAYYVIDKKNVTRAKSSADPDSSVGFQDLTGAEQARGLDLDFYARPIKELQIGGGGLFNQTEIVSVRPHHRAHDTCHHVRRQYRRQRRLHASRQAHHQRAEILPATATPAMRSRKARSRALASVSATSTWRPGARATRSVGPKHGVAGT